MININNSAPVKCNKSITIYANPKRVWEILTDINEWSKWNKKIPNAKLKGDLLPNATFVWETGGATIHSKLHTVSHLKEFGWTGKTFGMYAIHNWTFEEVYGNTQLGVCESMEGLLAFLFKKSFQKNLERDMQLWLVYLKNECEK